MGLRSRGTIGELLAHQRGKHRQIGSGGKHDGLATGGAERTTRSTPVTPPAPPTFSTMKGWPKLLLRSSATMRPMMSTVPPAEKGTTMVTGREGQLGGRRLGHGGRRED